MSGSDYLLGVFFAILSGVMINLGLLFQKKVINNIPEEARKKRFMRTLIRKPLWLAGFFLEYIVGGVIAFVLAEHYIGPTLVPGLMAIGFIVLAVGSIWILNESLNAKEYIGISLIITGSVLLALSGLEIDNETVRLRLSDDGTVFRTVLFTVVMLAIWGITHYMSIKSRRRRGVIMGFSNGFPFGLSNFWIKPLLAVIWIVLAGKGTAGQVATFVAACVIMILVNLFGIRQIQEAFKFGDAHNVIPMQQIPVQISQILYYFYVFDLASPSSESVAFILSGILLIIVSGFSLEEDSWNWNGSIDRKPEGKLIRR